MLQAEYATLSTKPNEPETSRWVLSTNGTNDQCRLKMVCFAHAGGGPSFYSQWGGFHSEVEVLRVALPGREGRRKEPAFNSMATLLPELLQELDKVLDSPYVLFGHSMGAAVAYEVAKHFEARDKGPQHLFVSGRRAPHLFARRRLFYDLPDKEFLSVLTGLNGTPESVINDSSLVDLFLPSLRADFTLIEKYHIDQPDPVNCPISAYGGDTDPEVECFELAAWKQLTSSKFCSQMFTGDHFYLKQNTDNLFKAMRNDLGLK